MMKKGLFFALGMLGITLLLNGCTGTVIKKGEPVQEGQTFTVSNYDKLRLKTINLSSKVINGDPQNNFNWDDVVEDVKDTLEGKGIVFSEDGVPVTLVLNQFVSYNTAGFKSPPMIGGALLAVGGNVVQAVAANLAESAISNSVQKNESTESNKNELVLCNTSACGYMVDFTIISDNYESKINISYDAGISNPIFASEMYTAKAISEMIEFKNNKNNMTNNSISKS
jgi:hypothetical protein